MSVHELRNADDAARFIRQGLWLQRLVPLRAAAVRPALEWALELASGGEPLLPVGLIADVGHLAFGADHGAGAEQERLAVPGFPAGLARAYEDQVLGKLYADWSFERAADALRRYRGRDQARGLAFLLNQLRQRAGFGGVLLSPAAIKAALERPPEEVLTQGWETLHRDGLLPLFPGLYEELIAAVRNAAEALGPEDVFELEHGTALAAFSQRVALRQVLQAAAALEAGLPHHKVRPSARRHDVPTHVLDEDTYPVGGFSSIATHGSVESLLHSQLAYMERHERPDLFDVKYLRDELLYYARDENQFLRRRRTFVFALFPDLVQARFKDAELRWQRIVLLLALLLTALRKLTDWLGTDALVFEFLFVDGEEGALAAEEALLAMLLREPIANGTALIERVPEAQLAPRCTLRARRSLCHCLVLHPADRPVQAEETVVARLQVDGPRPALGEEGQPTEEPEADDAMGSWVAALERLLQSWV